MHIFHRAPVLFLFLLVPLLTLNAQGEKEGGSKDSSSLGWGLSIGVYFPAGNSASFYEGRDPEYGVQRLFQVQQFYRRIKKKLKYDFELAELPDKMSYNTAFIGGLNGSWEFRDGNYLDVEFLFTKLALADKFTILVHDPSALNQERFETYNISGQERRFLLPIAYRYEWGKGPFLPFLRLGGTVGWAEAKQNRITIEGQEFSILPSDHPRYGNPKEQKGMILGGHAELGLKVATGSDWDLGLAGVISYDRVAIGNEPGFALEQSILLRLMR
ncbi:MAG: hypothetical protein ABEH38_00920 [Flavobacteriales bacterium]